MKKFKLLLASFAVAMFGVLAFAPVAPVSALDPLEDICSSNPDSKLCANDEKSATDILRIAINTLLFIVGSLSVIMIIVGGIFYVTSTGDSGKVSKAKNTVMYAVVGLVVSLLAYAIVDWVVRLL